MPKKVLAAVLVSQGQDLELQQFALTEPDENGILVKIECCTICGSDIHSWQGRRPTPVPGILGHEIVGTIELLGKNVTHDCGDRPLKIGDRITWTLIDVCGRCYFCRDQSLVMKCRHLKKYGHEGCEQPPYLKGGFAEYCYLTSGTRVIKIPDRLSSEVVAPANCALATVIAGMEAAEIKPLESILIQGAGALGIYAAAFASYSGCRQIIVTDVLAHRLEFIKSFGATDTINVENMSNADIVKTVRDLTGGLGVDRCLEVAGLSKLIPVALKSLRIGGCCVEIGNSLPGAHFKYDACDVVWRKLTLKGIHNYHAGHLQQAIDLLATTLETYPFEKIVTHRFDLDQINDGLRMAASGQAIRAAVLP
jgi:alcohol dehydrogenase